MATIYPEPSELNGYLEFHVKRLLDSFRHWTGKSLIDPNVSPQRQARQLFHAPFVVLSHNAAADPILTYANLAGLHLFELTWGELTALPSRLTAEPIDRGQRAGLLLTVSERGYIDDYCGVRISRTGRRFRIERATVWNLLDEKGVPCGQAATFADWRFLD